MSRTIVRSLFRFLAVVVVLGGLGYGLAWREFQRHRAAVHEVAPVELGDAMAHADLALGRRIVEVRNACTDCHGADLGGKVVIDHPALGRVVSKNLTPHGLRGWSDAEIARAIHEGVGRDGRALLIMPSDEYHRMSRGDLASVVAYLRSVPEVARDPGESRPGPLAFVLFALGKLPRLFPAEMIPASAPTFADKPAEGPTREFGSYLVRTSCMSCHRDDLSGGPIVGAPPDWAPAADLRPAALASWTEADFVRTLRTGVNPSGHALRPPMPVAFTSKLSDEELGAMWRFLREPEALARR